MLTRHLLLCVVFLCVIFSGRGRGGNEWSCNCLLDLPLDVALEGGKGCFGGIGGPGARRGVKLVLSYERDMSGQDVLELERSSDIP